MKWPHWEETEFSQQSTSRFPWAARTCCDSFWHHSYPWALSLPDSYTIAWFPHTSISSPTNLPSVFRTWMQIPDGVKLSATFVTSQEGRGRTSVYRFMIFLLLISGLLLGCLFVWVFPAYWLFSTIAIFAGISAWPILRWIFSSPLRWCRSISLFPSACFSFLGSCSWTIATEPWSSFVSLIALSPFLPTFIVFFYRCEPPSPGFKSFCPTPWSKLYRWIS